MTIQELTSDSRFPLHWQMGHSQRMAIIQIAQRMRPKLSLEIGTYKGGSLQVLSYFSDRVISIDTNPHASIELAGRFSNVDFRVGNSSELLPSLVAELSETGDCPEFILVDGDHSEGGVRSDINTLLQLKPAVDSVMLCHDSFNPACRRGILGANWNGSRYVHEVEIDFVSGHFSESDFDTARKGEMWDGLAIAALRPEERQGDLLIRESQRTVFHAALSRSVHRHELSKTRKTAAFLQCWIGRCFSYWFVRCRPARWIRSFFRRASSQQVPEDS